MLSRMVIKKQRGRRWLTALAGFAVIVGTLATAGLVSAVHDDKFQLDGDVSANCPPAPDTGLCNTATQKDWADLFTVTTGATNETVANSAVITTGGPFTNATFIRDFETGASCTLTSVSTTFCTGDDTTFATGSKDTLDIPKWQCNHDNNVNSKIDIMNAYAAAVTAPNGDKLMYFGLEKNKDNGTNDVGFWFLQGDASCAAPSGHKDFIGTHAINDVLVVSEFTNGGGVSNITAYRWVGGTNPLVQIGTAGDCKGSLANDNMCATTNSGTKQFNTKLATPWLSSDATLGVGRNQIVPPDFFEGGINLTKAFNTSGGGTVPSCFNTFIADTRSSNVTGSTLFDFARGVLGQCRTTLSTRAGLSTPPKTGEVASPTSIGGGSVSSGTDTATVEVLGTSNWTGTLTFFLCGPDSTLTTCDQSKGVLVTTTTNVTANGAYVSGVANLTSAGKYCWSAHFEPSAASKLAGVKAADEDGTNECFTVAPVTPSLTTCSGTFDTATPPVCTPGATVDLGASVSDVARVTGLAKEPGNNGGSAGNYLTINATNGAYAGSIEFTLKGPANSGCGVTALGTGTNPQTVSIDTAVGNKTYGPVSFQPGAPGKYHWQATLSNASSVNNNLPVTDNTLCDQAREDVTVRQIPTGVITKQDWIPNDTATVSSSVGNLVAGGSVVFQLWNTASCDGTLLYTQTVSVPGGNPTAEVNTTNTGTGAGMFRITTAYADAADTTKSGYSWKVTYTPAAADTAHLGSSSTCSAEHFSVTYTNDNTP